MFRRPQKGETEEDLLKAQELFEREKRSGNFVPAATAKGDKNEDESRDKADPGEDDEAETPDIVFHFPVDIVERDLSSVTSVPVPVESCHGFPETTLDAESCAFAEIEKKTKRESLFAKRLKSQKSENRLKTVELAGTSCIITGTGLVGAKDVEGEIKEIHEENVKKLASMSVEEIETARREIVKELKADIVKFLLNKRKSSSKIEGAEVANNENEDQVLTNVQEDLPIPLDEVVKNKWLHMDVVEKEKLEWTKPVQRDNSSTSLCPSARFGFDGLLISTEDAVDVQRGLHHHGEEPDRAGYTINELLSLIQSQFPSQKILALQTLSKIMERNRCGYFDHVLNAPLEKVLFENTEVLLMVRKCLDDQSDAVLAAGIRCMRSLLCNTLIEEALIDRLDLIDLLPLAPLVPELDECKVSHVDAEHLKDDELVRQDAVACLLRTDVVHRLRYVLEFHHKFQEDKFITENSIDILIRLARHSPEARKIILNCPFLLDVIVDKLLPYDVQYVQSYAPAKALKLLRLLLTENSAQTSMFSKLLVILQVYFAFNVFGAANVKSEALQLLVETLKLWSVVLKQCISVTVVEKFTDLLPLMAERLQICIKLNVDAVNLYELAYVSHLVHCITYLPTQHSFHNFSCETMKISLFKWIGQTVNLSGVPDVAVLMCLSVVSNYILQHRCWSSGFVDQFVALLDQNSQWISLLLRSLHHSSSLVTALTRDMSASTRDAACLPSYKLFRLGCDFSTEKAVNSAATLSFVCVILEGLSGHEAELRRLILNPQLTELMDGINKRFIPQKVNFIENFEVNVLASVAISSACCVTKRGRYYSIVLSLFSCVTSPELQIKLIDFLFSNEMLSEIYSTASTDVPPRNQFIDLMDSLKSFYHEIVPLKTREWIYEPLVLLFKANNCHLQVIIALLHYVYLVGVSYENYYSKSSSLAAHFAFIATTFLLNGDAFLNEDIDSLLKLHLKFFISKNLCLESSSMPLLHVSDFSVFFDMLVKHYESVSYGHVTYTNYLLLFLQQNADIVFRKKFLTENVFALRAVIIDFKDVAMEMQRFIEPVEADAEMLELYVKCLLSRAINPQSNKLLYAVSIHHVHSALFRDSALKENHRDVFERLTRSVEMTKNLQLKQHLLNYTQLDTNSPLGFSVSA